MKPKSGPLFEFTLEQVMERHLHVPNWISETVDPTFGTWRWWRNQELHNLKQQGRY